MSAQALGKKRPLCRQIYPLALGYCALLTILALILDGPARIWAGLPIILTSQSVLITDYVALGGVGAALVNSALVVLSSLVVLRLAGSEWNAGTVSTLGLLAGF